MYELFELAKRGGISQVGSKRYIEADQNALDITQCYIKNEPIPEHCLQQKTTFH